MKRAFFFTAYAATCVPPVLAYVLSLGSPGFAYSLSMALGACAFIVLANQFILASRPSFAVNALGLKGLLSFHAKMPIVAIVLAIAHRTLKVGILGTKVYPEDPFAARSRSLMDALREGLGFVDDTSQTSPGVIALIIVIVISVVAGLFMANTALQRVKPLADLKTNVYKKTGLKYGFFRLIHDLAGLAGLALIGHIALATSGPASGLPFASVWCAAWMLIAVAVFALYKIRSARKAKPDG
jgi:predicted ferric reductase